MNSIRLPHGQSGATLQVLSYQGNSVVRKTAASIQGNARLQKQMKKQHSFSGLETSVRSPQILGSGHSVEGLFYFDMEFIPGLDGHRFLESCDPQAMRHFAEKLSTHLSSLHALALIGSETVHRSLYDSCVSKLSEVHRQNVGLTDELADMILSILEPVRESSLSEQGFCHGDFTLENIMVDLHGVLHLVDFLDSNFEHPLQDYMKLGQDIYGGWLRIKGRRISPSFIAYLDDMVTSSGRGYIKCYDEIRPSLLALNFCRILPYVEEKHLKDLVIQRIEQFTRTVL